jgi:hypothetical protein
MFRFGGDRRVSGMGVGDGDSFGWDGRGRMVMFGGLAFFCSFASLGSRGSLLAACGMCCFLDDLAASKFGRFRGPERVASLSHSMPPVVRVVLNGFGGGPCTALSFFNILMVSSLYPGICGLGSEESSACVVGKPRAAVADATEGSCFKRLKRLRWCSDFLPRSDGL